MAKVEQITAVATHQILEGPHWDDKSQSLYFIDIYESLIFRYDYHQNKCYQAKIDGEESTKLGFIVPIEGKTNQFIIGAGPKLLIVQWDGKSLTATRVSTYVEVEKNLKVTRFNDGKADPRGRVFSGTLRSEEHGNMLEAQIGSLYCIESGKARRVKHDIYISNGLAWNKGANKFYYIDTGAYDVKEFDYNPETGDISNERELIDFKVGGICLAFAPDGMTIDEAGNLYVAAFNGGKVLKISTETREIVEEILIPGAKQITSVCFGGPNLDELFVTSANMNKKPAPAGGLFKVTGLGVKGLKGNNAILSN